MRNLQGDTETLIARYGYSPHLLAWEFINEFDNVYSLLNANDVAAWHGTMGRWLKANDPFGHLVTSSLTGNSDRPELWSLPEMDFANYHSYGESAPATRLTTVTRSFLTRYAKPVLIGEFGVSASGWNRASDPYLRGLPSPLGWRPRRIRRNRHVLVVGKHPQVQSSDPKNHRWCGYAQSVAGHERAREGLASFHESADWEVVGP